MTSLKDCLKIRKNQDERDKKYIFLYRLKSLIGGKSDTYDYYIIWNIIHNTASN